MSLVASSTTETLGIVADRRNGELHIRRKTGRGAQIGPFPNRAQFASATFHPALNQQHHGLRIGIPRLRLRVPNPKGPVVVIDTDVNL